MAGSQGVLLTCTRDGAEETFDISRTYHIQKETADY